MTYFDPYKWFWIVGGDESRAWSSASGSYVTQWDAERVTRIDTDDSLADVLRPYGLALPVVCRRDLSAAKLKISGYADAIATAITGPVPETERASWPTKEIAARAWLTNTAEAHQSAMLQAEAALTGETVTALATKVVQNASAYIAIAGTLTGFRRAYMAQIDALPLGSGTGEMEEILAAAKRHADAILAHILSA